MSEFIIVSLLVGSFMLMTIGQAYKRNSKRLVSRHVRSSQRGGINKRKYFGGE